MAKRGIPNPLERRHLLERNLAEADLLAIADAYLAEGRSSEAVDFLVKANAEERLTELERQAVESGDAFLLRELVRLTGREPDASSWLELSAVAEAAGKLRYAEMARHQAERGEE